jgi:hypothetical protein
MTTFYRLAAISIAIGFVLALTLALGGCSLYRERFTHYPKRDEPGHVVEVLHVSVFQFGSAARLTTSTQTEEFIRDVNAEGIVQKTDGAALGELLKRVSRP